MITDGFCRPVTNFIIKFIQNKANMNIILLNDRKYNSKYIIMKCIPNW